MGGGEKSFSHPEGGGGTNSFGVVFNTDAWSFNHIRWGGRKKFKRGHRKLLSCLTREGGTSSFGPTIFPFCSTPPPS